VLILNFNFKNNRKDPFKVPFTYELYATGVRYELRSLSCHRGKLAHGNGAHGGHYINYSKKVSKITNQEGWYRADDRVTRKVDPIAIVPEDKPYLAYYVRLTASEPGPTGYFEQTCWETVPKGGNRPA
jgi:ubiquitin C-terminal hydrolase